MNGSNQVTIAHEILEATVSATGIEVAIAAGGVTAAIVGVPGPPGPAGEKGESGAPGTGLPEAGDAGQVLIKQSSDDLHIGWSTSFVIDPETGWIGAGTDDPKGPFHVVGSARALIVQNSLSAGNRWTISPGHPGVFDQSLIFAAGDTILDPSSHMLRLQPGQPLSLPVGAVAADGTAFGSQSSNALAFYQPFNGTGGRLAFRGAASSSTSVLEILGTYHDGSYHTANVMALSYSASGGPQVAIGGVTPTATLHVDGAIRIEPLTQASVPDPAASGAGAMVYVSDATGGPRPFWSDGSDWRDATGSMLS